MMAAILVVAIASFVVYQRQMEVQATVAVQEHIEKVCKVEDITRIEYQAKDLVILENQNGVWVNEQLGELTYNQEEIQQWINTLQNLETKEVVKHVKDTSVYGIGDESVTITLHDGQNNMQTIKLGDIIESEDSIYIQVEESASLYVVSYEQAKTILKRPNDFVDCSNVLQIPMLDTVSIQTSSTIALTKEDEKWYLRDYYEIPCVIDEASMQALLETIEEMTIVGYIGTYDDLEAYGLDEPRMTLTLNEDTKIAFGTHSGNNVYVTVNNQKDVYTVDNKLYAELVKFKPFDVINKQVVHLTMDQISEITLVNPQGTYEMSFDIEEPVAEEKESAEQNQVSASPIAVEEVISMQQAEEKGDVAFDAEVSAENKEVVQPEEAKEDSKEPVVATINEIQLGREDAQAWLEKIESSLCIEAPLQNPKIEQKEDRKAEATIDYILLDGSAVRIELIPYDINYYILRYNGMIEFAVNKEKITKMFNELTHFVKKS